jgi:hypothetical protein
VRPQRTEDKERFGLFFEAEDRQGFLSAGIDSNYL